MVRGKPLNQCLSGHPWFQGGCLVKRRHYTQDRRLSEERQRKCLFQARGRWDADTADGRGQVDERCLRPVLFLDIGGDLRPQEEGNFLMSRGLARPNLSFRRADEENPGH